MWRATLAPNFYPRPPRGGRRTAWMQQSDTEIFLSTPSARRATNAIEDVLLLVFISIHALREEGDADVVKQRVDFLISIHALREEGDAQMREKFSICAISIHALREEGDKN